MFVYFGRAIPDTNFRGICPAVGIEAFIKLVDMIDPDSIYVRNAKKKKRDGRVFPMV
jgi:hypothetical protein